jgi:DMSO/TMAO reductase YedYZ molybdopterin-dependent catalytic subunit
MQIETDQPDDERAYGRRTFLAVTGIGLSSLLWGQPLWRSLAGLRQPIINALPPSIVPNGWRIYTVASSMPRFDPLTWRLRIDGLVGQPLSLSYADLLRLPRAEQVTTFHCVTGWSVKDVRWAGVRFRDLLAAAAPRADASVLTFTSAERPYVDTLTLEQAQYPDAMLAYEMDGKPMKREHGAPVRVVMPRMYGYKNVKWVERITLGAVADPGYWEQRGYSADAWVGSSG